MVKNKHVFYVSQWHQDQIKQVDIDISILRFRAYIQSKVVTFNLNFWRYLLIQLLFGQYKMFFAEVIVRNSAIASLVYFLAMFLPERRVDPPGIYEKPFKEMYDYIVGKFLNLPIFSQDSKPYKLSPIVNSRSTPLLSWRNWIGDVLTSADNSCLWS